MNQHSDDMSVSIANRRQDEENAGLPPACGPPTEYPSCCLFVCGDVMTGRGIDQILPHPVDPRLYEPLVQDARDYLQLAQLAHGPIPYPVAPDYVWGDALEEFRHTAPDVRIINLETSITTSDRPWPDKQVHYRMNPRNIACLTVAGIDACALANNHVLDWGYEGLAETLAILDEAGIKHAGAGTNREQAAAPAILPLKNVARRPPRASNRNQAEISDGGSQIADSGRSANPQSPRVLLFSFGSATSGIPPQWATGRDRPGVNLLEDLSEPTCRRVAATMRRAREPGDVLVASIHWGGNWGYEIPEAQIRFARGLIEEGVDFVHGHSSHHAKALEIYRGRPILYGCGDFLTDYEGIAGHERFRGDLALMYFLRPDPASERGIDLRLVPLQLRRFQLRRASQADVQWLQRTLAREAKRFGTEIALNPDHSLSVRPPCPV